MDVEIRHFHICCGLGGGAKGFNNGQARVGSMRAKFRCIGGVDSDPAGIRDFTRAAGVAGTVLDLFDYQQYVDFHGTTPPAGWREATTEDMRRAAHYERPHIIFASFPCKGFSGLLSETKSLSTKYQALNRLTFRGLWLALETWKDDPPELIIFENVPRIATRGRHFLDQIVALLRSYGYAVAETIHDCGQIGGLGQSRKRFLLVARHQVKVPPFLYEPPKRRLRGVGEILDALPLPGDEQRGGPMHRVPALQWKTWVRLAFVEAGSDWRSLNKLAVADGALKDFGIAPDTDYQAGVLGVQPWDRHSGAVTSRGGPTNGTFAVADPRAPDGALQYGNFGVRDWSDTMGAVINVKSPGQGGFAVSDPRMEGRPRFNNTFRIVPFDAHSPAIAGPGGPAGGLAVADPRPSDRLDYKQVKYRVTRMDEASGVVISASTTGNGAFAVADPRVERRSGVLGVVPWSDNSGTVAGESLPPNGTFAVADPRPRALSSEDRNAYLSGGHYGVTGWDESSGAVPAFAKNNNGHWSVADPRDPSAAVAALNALPEANTNLVAIIRALDGTWHRPFTTLELAALQSLVDPETLFTLEGKSDSAWRERIGNAVPPDAAAAIASVMGRTLLLAWAGESFMLSADPIWVQPLTVALSVNIPEMERYA